MDIKQSNKKPIKVLIVEDSPTESLYLQYLLESDPQIKVVGNVSNGKLAIKEAMQKKPDIITMDIDMPVMNGLDATRTIMSTCPIPILVVTASRNAAKHDISMEALAAGALNVVQKPRNRSGELISEEGKKLISMVKIYSEVKVVRRRGQLIRQNDLPPVEEKNPYNDDQINRRIADRKYIVIGISSGGPDVLKRILSGVSKDFPIPILVVQHITDGFLPGMVRWLDTALDIPVKIAEHGEMLMSGRVYFAPSNSQMGIYSNKVFLDNPEGYKITPSISYTFDQFAKRYAPRTIAMLMTGMGTDGAKELKKLRELGALTIAQDKESSLVHGMAGTAINMDAAHYVFNPEQISFVLQNLEIQYKKNQKSE